MDDLRFRSQRSPPDDTTGTMSLVTPPRNGSRVSQQSQAQQPQHLHHLQSPQGHQTRQGLPPPPDARSHLPRRFTTESGRVPTLSSVPLTSPQRGPDLSQDYGNQSYHKVQLIEKKKLEYERIREQRRRFELEMQRLDQDFRREARELAQMEEDVRLNGHQSEPTTPPEHNSGFPSIFSRPNRYSMSSLASPPGFHNRPARSGSQLMSPPSGLAQGRYGWDEALPSRSVPITRRNSDDEDKDEPFRVEPPVGHRSSHTHRYSMPGSRSRNGLYETGLDGTNVTRFLFGDDEAGYAPPATASDERFPTLVRRDDQMLSASSAALDLASSSSPSPDVHPSSHWASHINRHRTQQSLSAISGPPSTIGSEASAIGHRPASLRQSLDLTYISENAPETLGVDPTAQPGANMMASPPRLQSSYSSNDVPTVRSTPGSSMGPGGNANSHAQQHFHNHNASMGRIPAGAVQTRGHSRELSGDNTSNGNREPQTFQSIQSALHASAAPFGPSSTTTTAPSVGASMTTTAPSMAPSQVSSPPTVPTPNGFNGFYPPANPFVPSVNQAAGPNVPAGPQGPYGMNMLTSGMQQMNVNGGATNGAPAYTGQNFTPSYGSAPAPPYNQGSQHRDSQARVIQNRRQMDNEAMSRYQNMPLDSFRGQIYDLCKDQHGCRYLQKKLEERNAEQVHVIWLETNQHVIELMTDPFGNYLCQKLLEFCNDDERTVLIQNASQDMVRIALNTHGTRALQKMIEYVGTPQQVHLIIEALRFRVVELIQDLNGNHVIQKCLNKLTAPDSQFIFDAVGNNCVEVGTHRHGCCVLQRCIDHASGDQKLWLIQRITEHSRILVQDPFGNYVVQYIIDLNEPTFTEPIVGMFQGCISQLSRHKFSSNVIEKCLRCSQPPSKDMIVEEMLSPQEMERLIRDSYANYVVQTAIDYATPHQKQRLVESIRPILPSIRNTPYGRRIQAKVTSFDGRGSVTSSGQATPADNTQGQIPLRPGGHSRGVSGSGPAIQSNGAPNGLPNGGSSGSLNHHGLDHGANAYQNGGSAPAPPAPANQPSAPQQGNGGPWM